MAPAKPNQGADGVPLEDMQPYVPGVQPPGKVKNFSRPFQFPIHDPQGSNSERPPTASTSFAGAVTNGASASSSASNVRDGGETGNAAANVGRYSGNRSKAQAQLGVLRNLSQSLISMTPSDLPVVTSSRELSRNQFQELNRVIRHENGGTVPTPLLNRRENSVSEPPDGGALAWAHAFAGFLVTFNTQGLNLGFGMFQAYYEKRYLSGESPSRIAWIGSFQIFATFFMCLFTSPLLSKGYFRPCFLGGVTLMGVGLYSASYCTKWWELMLTQGIIVGLGMGLSFSSGIVVLTSYFSTRLGIATAIASTGGSFGGIVFPIIVNNLLEVVGFMWTMQALMLINVVTMAIANAIATPRPARRNAQRLTMDWAAFKDLPYLLMMAGLFFCFWGIYFGFYFIVSYGEDILQMPPDASINLLIAMNGANFLGRFVPSLISDACIGPVNTVIPSAFLASVLAFLWVAATSPVALFLVGCFYGFVAAGIQSLYPSTVLSFSGPDRSRLGSRLGFVLAAIGLGSLTGAPLGGQLISRGNGTYLYAELFAGSSLALGAVLLLAARLVKRGWGPARV